MSPKLILGFLERRRAASFGSMISYSLRAMMVVGCCLLGSALSRAADPTTGIRVNSIGFLPDAPKRATVVSQSTTFKVVRVSDGTVVIEGKLGPEQSTNAADTDERVHVADFSQLKESGRYRLEVPGVEKSAEFDVGSRVWTEPFRVVSRGLYLWRCGVPVNAEYQGHTWSHAACHLEDGWMDYIGGGHVQKKGTGGWHDAGDYNKYVVNAGVSVGLIFKAWEHFRPQLEKISLQLPESGNGTPDLMNELRFEFDWLFTMQGDDGRVYHKLTARNFSYWGPPEGDRDLRYFSDWGTTATADFVAMMAMGARHFREFDSAYADRCLAAARKSYAFLGQHPENVKPDLSAFSTGAYGASDVSHRLWAAAELWATTHEAILLKDFEARAAKSEFTVGGPTWSDVEDLALATYLETSSDQRAPALVARLQKSLFNRCETIISTAASNAYARPLGVERKQWFWGANGSVAAQTFLLHLADRLKPDPRYRQVSLDALGVLFGRNYHARSYVTGLGYFPPNHPHDRRGGDPAWPGYLVGGGWPNGRSWVDDAKDYRQNEIALNWNASLIYALSAFVTN